MHPIPLLALAAGFASATIAGAADLDLRQAMARARTGSLEVAAAAARLAAGEARARQAHGQRLPTVTLSETAMRTDSPAEAFALTLNQERFSLSDFAAGDPNHPEPVEAFTTRLEVVLPVYTGGEVAARMRQADHGVDAARHGLDWSGDRAAHAAGVAWVRLAEAREMAGLVERSLAALDGHVALARAYVEEGLLVRSELLRAEVERARVADLAAQAHSTAEVAEAALSFALGEPQDGHWSLAALPAPAPLPEGLAEYIATAAARRDLAAARSGAAAAAQEERARRAAGRPRLALLARGDRLDASSRFGDHGEATAVLAIASYDLFAGGRHRAAAAAARADAEAANHETARLAEGIALAVRRAHAAAVAARDRQATTAAALGAAREAERITRERFAQGVVKTLDLLDAETARREAETRELLARAEAVAATLELAVEAGRAPETALAALDPAGAGAHNETNPREGSRR